MSQPVSSTTGSKKAVTPHLLLQQSYQIMEGLEQDLKNLMDGHVVPILPDSVCITTHSSGFWQDDYVPIVKRTVSYIAMGLIFNEDGKLLLIQEAKQRIRGQWYIPAGQIEPGENFVNAVEREILEESGIYVESITLLKVQMKIHRKWIRFEYICRVKGGKLKTLAEQDEESLQAQWFTLDQIRNKEMKLRGSDFFKAMELAQSYLAMPLECRHPAYQVGIQAHRDLLQRLVILKHKDGKVEVLCYEQPQRCLPVIKLSSNDGSLYSSFGALIKDVFKTSPKVHIPSAGLLTLEHCGIPAREHDGMCLTVVYIVPSTLHEQLETVENKDYAWHLITNDKLVEQMNVRMFSQNLLIPIVH